MTTTEIENQIEAEPADIFSYAYESGRAYLDGHLSDELAGGDPVAFARSYIATARRALLHSLQEINAPAEIIAKVFSA
jgi:hypothetical protein